MAAFEKGMPTFESHGQPINLFLYHARCPDGLGAAAVAYKFLGKQVEYFACKHGSSDMPDVQGKHVLVADFCFSKPTLAWLKKQVASLLVLDHHKSAMLEIGTDDPCCYFDMSRSGAALTWDFFYPETPRPAMINYIEDRDIWVWKMDRSQEFAAAIDVIPLELESYHDLLERTSQDPAVLEEHLAKGAAMVLYRDNLVRLMAENAAERKWLGYRCLVANAPLLQSELGNYLAKMSGVDIAVIWNYDHERKSCRISLRTFHPTAPDVSAIAKQYGGGGHVRASGMLWPSDTIETLFEKKELNSSLKNAT